MAKNKMTFEQALAELETIVETMEGGELSLEELLGKFEKGIGLLRVCENILAQAEGRIEVLTKAQIDTAATEQPQSEQASSIEPSTQTEESLPPDELPWVSPPAQVQPSTSKKQASVVNHRPSADEIPLPEAPPEESLF